MLQEHTYDNAILSYLDMTSDLCGFHHRIRANMNMVTDFHRVIVEVPAVCLVRRPSYSSSECMSRDRWGRNAPHHASLTDEAVPPERNDNGMSRACSPQVSTDDCPARNDGLSPEDDVLRARDGGSTGDFVPRVLDRRIQSASSPLEDTNGPVITYRFDVFGARVVDWQIHTLL